jgi:hypothetical protein
LKKYKHRRTGIIVEQGVQNKNYYYAYKEGEAIVKWVVEYSLDWEEIKDDEEKYSVSDIEEAYNKVSSAFMITYASFIKELKKIRENG